jgi:DNA polymerase-3 subunit delta
MFSDYVCVLVRDLIASARENGVETLDDNSLKMLLKTISDLPDGTVLIFYNPTADITDGKKKITAKNGKIIDAVAKAGVVCEFKYKGVSELASDIVKKVKGSGSSISKQAAERLAAVCGCDTMLVGNEIAKLLSYADGREITPEMIDAVTPAKLESTAFDLARAVASRDGGKAVRLLVELTEQHAEPISVIYAVTMNMVDLYRARAAMSGGKTANDVIEDFGYYAKIKFRVTNAFRDAKTFSLPHLRECMRTLAKADADMKSLKADPQVILEQAIVKCLKK